MKAPLRCRGCTHLRKLGDSTKVRRCQASNFLRCAKYCLPAWDAAGQCKRDSEQQPSGESL